MNFFKRLLFSEVALSTTRQPLDFSGKNPFLLEGVSYKRDILIQTMWHVFKTKWQLICMITNITTYTHNQLSNTTGRGWGGIPLAEKFPNIQYSTGSLKDLFCINSWMIVVGPWTNQLFGDCWCCFCTWLTLRARWFLPFLKRLLLILLLFFVLLVEIKGRLFLTRQGVKRVLFVDVVVSVFTIGWD